MFMHITATHVFSLLCSIPLEKYTTTHLSVLLLMDIWVVHRFLLLRLLPSRLRGIHGFSPASPHLFFQPISLGFPTLFTSMSQTLFHLFVSEQAVLFALSSPCPAGRPCEFLCIDSDHLARCSLWTLN